tara:strand:- start:6 stop:623 length:618 start_codon:yes stop_codon:yes gene_type:complete
MWECDRLNIPYSGNSPVNVKVNCYSYTVHPTTGVRNYFGPVLLDYDVDIFDTVGPFKGTVEFSTPSMTYNPYQDWKDYDSVSVDVDLGSDSPGTVDISFVDADVYQCPHNRGPKQNYARVGINNSGPMVPTNVECVLPIYMVEQGVATTRGRNGDEGPTMTDKEDCEAKGFKWNNQAVTSFRDGECQAPGIPDPFFRKNYISEGN